MQMNSEDKALAMALLAKSAGDLVEDFADVVVEPVTTGLSGATVLRATQPGRSPRYLKLAHRAAAAALRDEVARTQWLAAHGVAVPHVLNVEERPNAYAVLMDTVPGVPADQSDLPVLYLGDALGQALAALHSLSPAQCPFDETLAVRLARASTAVAAGEIDGHAFDARNHSIAPAALLAGLVATPPREDVVVVHGDATMSNLMIDNKGQVGFIDCSNAGRGDRYLDLALLAADIENHHGAEAAVRFRKAYGVNHWDHAKARFYLDLYEFF
jgi:aminoglycoside 3'-phosphotransferase II